MKLLPALAALLLAAPASAQLDPDAEVPRAAAAPAPGGAPCITAGPKGPEVLALPVDGTERSAMIAARCPLPLSGLAFPKEDLKNLPKNCPGTLGPLFHPEGRYDTLESVSAYIAKGIAAERFGKIAVHATPHTQFCGEKEGSRKDDSRYFAGAAKDHINLGLAVRVQARLALESQLGDRDLACGLTQIGGEFCYTVMHETLHLLNLDDEYSDKACPGRAFIAPETDPASFMDGSKGGPSFVLMPRHMLRILRPLCL